MARVALVMGTGLCLLIGSWACRQQQPGATSNDDSAQKTVDRQTSDRQQSTTTVIAVPDDDTAVDRAPKQDPRAGDDRLRQVYRPDDLRPVHDEPRLAAAGVRIFESKRLKLYTDIDAETARPLPPLIDQLYLAWEDYFGPLPPDRAGTDFQMSGFLIRDEALFRELGLLPENVYFNHGRHQRNEFWLRDQKSDYYRRHLLFHEATHSFMTIMPDALGPVWYMEGMAEYFGTHTLNRQGQAVFRVMPTTEIDFAGFARITTIREDVAAGRFRTIEDIFAFRPAEFLTVNHYAWSWALCIFLDQTPRYHERFQKLGRHWQGTEFARLFHEWFESDRRDLDTEWTLFTHGLQYGYDVTPAAINFQPGIELTDERKVQIEAGRGWQSSGVRVEKGQAYQVIATGQFTLADHPKPWVSESQGISFRYFDGRPIGTLIGCLRIEEGPAGSANESMLSNFVIGRDHQFTAPVTGTLYLRLNDAWNSLHDNRGQVSVSIQAAAGRARLPPSR